MNNDFDSIKHSVENYYSQKIATYGNVPKGVDWNSLASQELRFVQLLKVVNPLELVSLNDYGCGYGHLYEFMTSKGYHFDYHGYDLSELMISRAKELYGSHPNCHFWVGDSYSKVADYTVASGIFNVKLDKSDQEWEEYVIATLATLNTLSQSGFAFNILTSYSDQEYMRDDLYYANPCFYFDFCKRHFSKHVALLHDYGLYEFTILVRK